MSYTSPAVKARWNKKHYDRLVVLVPKEQEETIKAYVKEHNTSINGLINDLLRYEMGLTELQWKLKAPNPCEKR